MSYIVALAKIIVPFGMMFARASAMLSQQLDEIIDLDDDGFWLSKRTFFFLGGLL